ncbi:MAG: hypothetical protein JRI91_11310 [Deltaproteobacteria bacterium]|nr:hypothetical protein [Deltaproteobacteria bacterium]
MYDEYVKSFINFKYEGKMTKRLLFFFIFLLSSLNTVCLANQPDKKPLRILCLGDSITQSANVQFSYRYHLWKKMVDLDMNFDFIGSMKNCYPGKDTSYEHSYKGRAFDRDHEGHWGWFADQVLGITKEIPASTGSGNLSDWLKGYTPDIVLLHLGHNDAGLGEAPEEIAKELKKIISLLQNDNPNVSVLLAKVIPNDNPEWNKRLNNLNSVIQGVAEDMKNNNSKVLVIDFSIGFDARQDTFDGIHPNKVGAEKMAQKWLKGILKAIQN